MSRAGPPPARADSERAGSRRAFLRTGALAAGGGAATLALGACGGGDSGGVAPLTVSAVPGKDPDVDLMNAALRLELIAIAVYAASTGVLHGASLTLGRTLLGQEMEHADVLSQEITQLGGTPAAPHGDYSSAVGGSRDERAMLRAALAISLRQINGYLDTIAGLARPELRAVVASILADQAEHVALLRRRLGLGQVASLNGARRA